MSDQRAMRLFVDLVAGRYFPIEHNQLVNNFEYSEEGYKLITPSSRAVALQLQTLATFLIKYIDSFLKNNCRNVVKKNRLCFVEILFQSINNSPIESTQCPTNLIYEYYKIIKYIYI